MAPGLEALSIERFDQILSYMPECYRRSSVSRPLNKKMMPYSYNSWCFGNSNHTFRSLSHFLRSVLLNPEIAPHVHKTDIRKWAYELEDSRNYLASLDDPDDGLYDDDETDDPEIEPPFQTMTSGDDNFIVGAGIENSIVGNSLEDGPFIWDDEDDDE
jgi:hypothetical protein